MNALRLMVCGLLLLTLLGVLPLAALAQEPDSTPDAALAFIEAVSGGEVESVTTAPDGGQIVVVEAPADESQLETLSIALFGLLVVAAAGFVYVVRQNSALASKLSDYLPPEAWESIYSAGVKTAMDYAQKTPTTIDDDLVKLVAQQVKGIWNAASDSARRDAPPNL